MLVIRLPNPFENDELRWKEWDCTFYGRLPTSHGESAASLVLPTEVVLNQMNWVFPVGLDIGWVLDLTIGELIIETIPLSMEPSGSYNLNESYRGLVLPKGTLLSTQIRYLRTKEGEEIPPFTDFQGERYSIFFAGSTFTPPALTTLAGAFDSSPISRGKWFNEWQDEHS
jgi:hypothetical protein